MRHEAGGGVIGLAEVVANQVAGKLAQGASSWFPRVPTKAAVLDQVEHEAGLPRTRATGEENSPAAETVFEDINSFHSAPLTPARGPSEESTNSLTFRVAQKILSTMFILWTKNLLFSFDKDSCRRPHTHSRFTLTVGGEPGTWKGR